MSDESYLEDRPIVTVSLRERIEARRRAGYGNPTPPIKRTLTAEEWDAQRAESYDTPDWRPRKVGRQMIYFIQAGKGGPIKIGYAVNPKKRLNTLQTSHHAELTMLATVDGGPALEASYHSQFAEWRLRGEWFSPASPILAEIARLKGDM